MRPCSFCGRFRIVFDCQGPNCEAHVCEACADPAIGGWCSECADERRREDAREAHHRKRLAEIIAGGAIVGGTEGLLDG